jgi:hypothetical protein
VQIGYVAEQFREPAAECAVTAENEDFHVAPLCLVTGSLWQ